ncbi:MAG: zinc-dependent alcohol dehydrogenase family protein [Saprospiraceae bacterium]
MQAAIFTTFKSPIEVTAVPDPQLAPNGAIIQVMATGICRSDWHGWMGHDSDVQLPHVPGHELAGIVLAVGKNVRNWQKGDRVTLPFCCGCGYCPQCNSGNQQICDNYFQPGFTAWGSFAEYVHIDYVDVNLVRLPETMSFEAAAVLGCRFITAYRGIIAQGKLQPGHWVAIHGCGGVGLSALMIANAIGAQTIAIDIDDTKLAFAKSLGADITLNANTVKDIPLAIKELTKGGVSISVDALGSSITCINSILSLRKRGKHIQIGLMTENHATPPIPMGTVIANELEIIGSHGMQAHQYPEMLDLIFAKNIPLEQMIGRRMGLKEGAKALMEMNQFKNTGVMVINP